MPKYNELFTKRESCRAYLDKPVDTEDILNCIRAARLAPSAHNSQPYSVVLVNNKSDVLKIAPLLKNGANNTFCNQCQSFLLVMEENDDWGYASIDIGMFTLQFCQAATEIGLGTCIIGIFNENEIRKIINIKTPNKLRLVVAIGYPKETVPRRKMRKSMEQLVQIIED